MKQRLVARWTASILAASIVPVAALVGALLVLTTAAEAQDISAPNDDPMGRPAYQTPQHAEPAPPSAAPAPPADPRSPETTPPSAKPPLAAALTAPNAAAKAAYDDAIAALRQRDNKRAIELFDRTIQAAPGFAPAYGDRGIAHMNLSEYPQAIDDLSRAIELIGSDGPVAVRSHLLANRGVAWMNQKQFDKAADDFDTAIRIAPSFVYALTNRGYLHFQRKDYRSAMADLDRSIEIAPEAPFAHLLRAFTRNSLGQHIAAIDDFRKVLSQQPDNQGAILGLRQAYLGGKTQEDIAKIRLVRAADGYCEPSCAEWIAIEGRIDSGMGERFGEFLKTVGKRKLPVLVDSGGGSVNDALEMGRLIRARGLDVIVSRTEFLTCPDDDPGCRKRQSETRSLGRPVGVGAICASSCAFLIAAGARRYVGASSLVGVHQVVSFQTYQKVFRQYEVRRAMRNGRMVEIDRRVVSEKRGAKTTVQTKTEDATYVKVRKYFEEMGIGDSIMPLLLSAPPSSMHWLTPVELRSTSIMTDVADAEQLIARGLIDRVVLDSTVANPRGSSGNAGSDAAAAVGSPGVAPPNALSSEGLTHAIQQQLARLGCTSGAEDGKWGQGVRRALERYNTLTGQSLKTSAPSGETLEMLSKHAGPACPPACPPDMAEVRGQCVAKDKIEAKAEPPAGSGDGNTRWKESPKPERESPKAEPRTRTAGLPPAAGAPNHGGTTPPGASHGCSNHASTCSGSLSYCLSNCRERNAGARCFNDCSTAVTLCRNSGTWKTANCLKTGMGR